MIKARHTLIYLVILAVIGGYYYYFEVLKPREKRQVEQKARKVFQFAVGEVQALEILPRGKPAVRLVKEGRWQIREPIPADVDEASLNGVLNALESLQRDRQLAETPEDLKAFGLQEPALSLRFQLGEVWLELFIGDKNPVGDAYYAKTGDRPVVFLMAQGNWSIFDKEAKDLRRRQLFTFDPPAVTAMEVSWQGGERFAVAKDGTGVWKAPQDPAREIKKSKVDRVLDRIHWLRARDFLAESPADMKAWGLDPPYVSVKLQLNEGQNATLRLSHEDPGKKQAMAAASELAGVLLVESEVLKDLPQDLRSLEDRNLLAFKTDQVRQVIWKSDGLQGHLVRTDDTKWVWKLPDGRERELAQSWQIRSLLWELDQAEYERREPAAGVPTMDAPGYLELRDGQEKLAAVSWQPPTLAESPTVAMTLMSARAANPVTAQISLEILRKVEQKLAELSKNQPQ
jgi:hypothetical protein